MPLAFINVKRLREIPVCCRYFSQGARRCRCAREYNVLRGVVKQCFVGWGVNLSGSPDKGDARGYDGAFTVGARVHVRTSFIRITNPPGTQFAALRIGGQYHDAAVEGAGHGA